MGPWSPDSRRRIARLGIAARSPRIPARGIVRDALLNAVLIALFPGLARRVAWVARASLRGVVVYTAVTMALRLVVDWMIRAAARGAIEREELEARLRRELGRPPWPGEVDQAWREAHGFGG